MDEKLVAIGGLTVLGLAGMYMGIDSGFYTMVIGLMGGIAGYHIKGTRK